MAFDIGEFFTNLTNLKGASQSYLSAYADKRRREEIRKEEELERQRRLEEERQAIAAATGKSKVTSETTATPEASILGLSYSGTPSKSASTNLPSVDRPAYTTAALMQAQRTAAPVAEAANRFSTAQGLAPYTESIGSSLGQATTAEHRNAAVQANLARAKAEPQMGLDWGKLGEAQFKETMGKTRFGKALYDYSTAEQEGKLPFARPIGEAQGGLTLDKTLAELEETKTGRGLGVPGATAENKLAELKSRTQAANIEAAIGERSPQEIAEIRNNTVKMEKATADAGIAQADKVKLLSLIQSSALAKTYDKDTGKYNLDRLGIKDQEVVQTMLGLIRGVGLTDYFMGKIMEEKFGDYRGSMSQPPPTTAGGSSTNAIPRAGTAFNRFMTR